MIISTVSNDSICRKGFGPSNVAISALESMMQKFALDPKLNNPPHEAYIVSNLDLRNKKVRDRFLEAAANKHPDVKIVYYSKKEDKDFREGQYPGIDRVICKATPQALADAVYELIEGAVAEKAPVVSSADNVETYSPFTPREFQEPEPEPVEQDEPTDTWDPSAGDQNVFVQAAMGNVEEHVEEKPEEKPEELPLPEFHHEPEPEPELTSDSELLKRISNCQKVGDLATLTREITASAIIKDVVRENSKYANYEMRLRVLNEKIYSVIADSTIPDGHEKLDRIQALLRDGDPYRDENTNMIGKHLEMIIDTVVSKTREVLDKRLQELNRALLKASVTDSVGGEYARLAGIMDARSNIMLELLTIEDELKDMFVNLDKTETEVTEEMTKKASRLSNSPLIDSHIKAINSGETITKESLDAIVGVLDRCDKSSEEFQEAVRDVVVMLKKMDKLLNLDRDAITNLTALMKMMKANNVEDTVIARTVLKRALRIFIGKEGSGRTVLPLTVAKMKSRENCNTLYLDLTGTCKAEDYGETLYTIEDWLENKYEDHFVGVSGEIANTPEAAQRLLAVLMKVADYFGAIYVIIDPEQLELLHVLQPETLVVNYLMEPTNRDAAFYKQFMKDTVYGNVGRRIVLNKCNIETQTFLERLGAIEDFNIQFVKAPYLPTINSCSLSKVKPYEIDSIREELREVIRTC